MITFLWPSTWLLYTASALLGIGAAIIWTAQGSFLSRCSDETTISRNSGIFWAMLQMRSEWKWKCLSIFLPANCPPFSLFSLFFPHNSMFIGNLFVFFQFQGKTHIDEETRTLVFSVLIGVGFIGFFFLMVLRPAQDTRVVNGNDNGDDDELASVPNSVITVFKGSVNLFFTKEMLLLSLTFFYTGKWRVRGEWWKFQFILFRPDVVVLYLIASLIESEVVIWIISFGNFEFSFSCCCSHFPKKLLLLFFASDKVSSNIQQARLIWIMNRTYNRHFLLRIQTNDDLLSGK